VRRPETLTDTLQVALGIALFFAAIVLLIGLVGGAVHLAKHGLTATAAALPGALFGGAAIVGAYFVAALVGAPVYHLLSPLGTRLLGEVVLSGIIGFIVYGTMALTGVLGYVFFGLNILDFDSPAQAWKALLPVTVACAGMTAILFPIVRRVSSRGR
jgi:hypothetical protein